MIARAAALLVCAGCLGRRVSDTPPGEDNDILPAGTPVPSADDDPAMDARIAAGDQVSGIVPRRSVFAGGALAHAWDLGPAPAFATPLYVLVRETSPDVYERIDHPPIAISLPGEPTYSPFATLLYVEVTPAYQGELLTSDDAVRAAVAQGLVEPPFVAKHGVAYPIVASDVRLEVGGGAPPLAPATRLFYDGEALRYYDLGDLALSNGVDVDELPRYVLRREGGEPLSEPIRHVDLDGDGDTDDTNDVFALAPGDAGYSPRRRTVTVAVPASTSSIDTTQNEALAAIRDAAQLFDPDPVAGTVLAFDATDELRVMPLQRQAGGL